MILSLSCLVTLSYSLSHSISCAGFYKFVVRDDVISPAGVRNFGTYDDVFEHVHGVARVRKNWATVVANKSGCANGPESPKNSSHSSFFLTRHGYPPKTILVRNKTGTIDDFLGCSSFVPAQNKYFYGIYLPSRTFHVIFIAPV